VIGQVVASLRIILAPDDPVALESLAGRLLPRDLLEHIHSAGGDGPWVEAVRGFAQHGARDDPDTKKAWRFVFHVENLLGMARRHSALPGVVDELLAQRIGPYHSPLEDRSDEISDPASYPGAAALAADIERAAHGGRVPWRPPRSRSRVTGNAVADRAGACGELPGPETTPEPGDTSAAPRIRPPG
jgi:hypothetical protein